MQCRATRMKHSNPLVDRSVWRLSGRFYTIIEHDPAYSGLVRILCVNVFQQNLFDLNAAVCPKIGIFITHAGGFGACVTFQISIQ